jgi:hypothetical protein
MEVRGATPLPGRADRLDGQTRPKLRKSDIDTVRDERGQNLPSRVSGDLDPGGNLQESRFQHRNAGWCFPLSSPHQDRLNRAQSAVGSRGIRA